MHHFVESHLLGTVLVLLLLVLSGCFAIAELMERARYRRCMHPKIKTVSKMKDLPPTGDDCR